MKTQIILSANELNNEYRKAVIEICLNDECKNGHEDFAITASFWSENNFSKNNPDMCGCCHDEILKFRPDLKLFVDLHLSTSKGVPMYAIENGFYHLKNSDKQTVLGCLRITEDQYNIIKLAEDKYIFQYLIEGLKLPEQWQNEANEAIKMLQEMTGEKYTDHSTKETFVFLTDEKKAEIKTRIDSGYYQPKEITKRANKAFADAKEKVISELKTETEKKIRKLRIETEIKCKIIDLLGPEYRFNAIFYDSTRKLVFNWHGKNSYEKSITKEQFEGIKKTFERSQLWLDGEIKEIVLNDE